MSNTSFVQSDFRAGKWSPNAQGKMHDQRYKAAMNICNNGMPLFNGPWTRRSGFLWGGNSRQGQYARLIDCYLKFSEPFQLELSNLVMRMHVGNGWVFTDDVGATIKSISTATPAIVTLNGPVPSDWNNFDTVIFNLTAPSTSPILVGRQFVIQSISGSTFALYDGLTGAAINGNTQAYTAPTNNSDYIYKILELATPWSASVVDKVKLIQTDSSAVLLQTNQAPQALTVPPYGTFALNPAVFLDGPYFNINNTATTLTPSATSGTVTFTASSTAGINGGVGFVSTDIGRMLRFQSGPPAWAGGTTYANGAVVLGSDNNIYVSQIGGNIGHNPTTDNGTNWVVSGETIAWVWGYIQTVTDSTHIVVAIQPAAITGRSSAQINGDQLYSTNASAAWQLGLYSGTTGYPSVGTYYEGRLFLAGQVVTNRFDASCANDPYNFAPSAPDGTVGDGNALAEYSNAPKINQVLWMLPTSQGVLTGSDNGEWVVAASQLGDPLTPTSVQWHRVSTYGCADIEPQQTELTTCFVQREQQRVLNYANYPYGEAAGWFADNLSENADDLCAPGVAEIRFQQEPSHFLWARGNDGSLFGTTFEHAAYGKESYNGWHNHNIGGGRTVTSISTGPSSDGLTTTLYVIAFNPVSEYYEYLELDHIFDATRLSSQQNFTDGLAAPSLIKDTGTGVELYGMYEIIGQTVTLNIGGLDLGDFVVQGPDGHVIVPFTSTFTQAFYRALDAPAGPATVPIYTAASSPINNKVMGAYNPSDALSATVDLGVIDIAGNRLITVNNNAIRVFNLTTLVQEKFSPNTPGSGPFGFGSGTDTICYHPGTGAIYGAETASDLSNSNPIIRVDVDTLQITGTVGAHSSSFLPFGNPSATMIPLNTTNGQNLVAFAYETAGSNHNNGIGVLDADEMVFLAKYVISDLTAYLCPGLPGSGQFFIEGTPAYGGASTTALNFYSAQVSSVAQTGFNTGVQMTVTQIGSGLTPTDVDATWTHFNSAGGIAFDPNDGNLITYVTTNDSVTNTAYWVKISTTTGDVLWATAETTGLGCPIVPDCLCKLPLPNATFNYARWNISTGCTIYTLKTASGTLTSTSFPGSTDVTGVQLFWPQMLAIIGNFEVSYTGSPPGPYDSATLYPIGTYMTTSNSYGPGWGIIAPAWAPPEIYDVPLSIGANYTSVGQLLRPDFGQDAGAAAGPAFGKKRRTHWFAAAVVRSQNFNISTDNTFNANTTDTVTVMDEDENVVAQPGLYTGTLSTTMPDNYSFDSQIAWQINRPLPLTITAMGGFIATQDK